VRHHGRVPRVLLLLPTATYRAEDFQAAARALGADVVIGTERRLAISSFAEDSCLVVDLERPERAADVIAGFHERAPLDAIVGVDDQGVLAAAVAAERLGLRHNPARAVATTRDKGQMRTAFAAAAVPQPPFRVVEAGSDPVDAARAVGTPCVVKPVSLAASRGVMRVDDTNEMGAAIARVRAILADAGRDPSEHLLVERYVPGFEVVVEGLLRAGELDVLAVLDKPEPLEGPYFEETLLVTPSRLPRHTVETLRGVTKRATGALGLGEGPVHAELRVAEGRVSVLEVAARSIGGLCSRSLRFGAGASLEEVILRHALDLPVDVEREAAASGVMMIPIPSAGVLREVRGRSAASAVPGVEALEITIRPTRRVRPLPEGDRYLGFIFARAHTPREVEHALRRAHGHLDIVIDAGAGTAA
jgi:biotin carboxylase